MARKYQDARKGKNNNKSNEGGGGHKFGNKMKGKGGDPHFKNKNNKFAKKDWKKPNNQKPKKHFKDESLQIVQSEFSSRPQQGSFPDKKKILETQRIERKYSKKFERKGQNYRKDAVENMAKHLKKATSKNWVNREIDENQAIVTSDFEENESESDVEEEQKRHIKSFRNKAKVEAIKNPFEMFDELLDAKKAKKEIVEASYDEEEDTVPMANNIRKNPALKKLPVFEESEESDVDDDEEVEEDEAMDTDEEASDAEISESKNEDSEVTDFHKKISQMSMAQVKALRSKLGTKLFDKLLAESQQKDENVKEEVSDEEEQASENHDEEGDEMNESPKEESSKKKSRHAPREMSSKKPVSVYRAIDPNAINYSRRKFDPRFSERSGTYHESEFRNDYGFIDDLRKNDIQKLNNAMKQAKSKKEKEKIKDLVGRLKSQQTSVEERDLWRQTKNELLTSNIERMNQGFKPVFVNNKEMKERFKEKKLEKIEETRGKKGLEKYLKKKERRESKKKLL